MKRNEKIVSIGVKIVPILQKSRISVQFLHCITIATAPIILQSSSVPKSVMLHIKVGGTPIWVGGGKKAESQRSNIGAESPQHKEIN